MRSLLARAALLAAAAACSAPALASQTHPRIAEAKAAYEAGRPSEAASILSALAAEEGVSAGLHYDLGVSLLDAGEVGPAILSLVRAHWLAPSDAGIAAALAVARQRAGLPERHAPAWERARNVLAPDTWATFGGLALVLGCAGSVVWMLDPGRFVRTRGVRRALRAGTAVSSGAFLAAAIACASLAGEASRGIAVGSEVTLRMAPFEGAEPRATLGAGESVRIEERHGAFVRVRADGARWGWAPASAIGEIVPG